MNTVMIIGAGRGQIPIMDLCHSYGWKIISVSPAGNYPGLKIADEVLYEDVKKRNKILEYAKDKDIKAVITDQLDAGVLTSAYIAEKMNIHGITYDTALKFTDKYVMRDEARKAGIAVPKNALVKDKSELKNITSVLKYPLMIKPVDNAASRGVYKVNTFEELAEKFDKSKSYSKSESVIVEEFIEGREYVVEAYTKNYKTRNLVVGHRDYFNVDDTFIPNATVFVDADSADSHVEKLVKEANEKLITAFGLQFGITHGEYIYNPEEDKVYLVEIAARGGGVFISSDLIPLSCGVNANDLLVKEALGIPYDDEIVLKKGASAYFCYLTPEGVVSKLENTDKVEAIKGVSKAFFDNISLGMKTAAITDKSSRKGPVLVHGETKEDCYRIIEEVKQCLDIKVTAKKGLVNVLWN